jgi:hypothetical protein
VYRIWHIDYVNQLSCPNSSTALIAAGRFRQCIGYIEKACCLEYVLPF